jgi:hypothetical protein
MYQEHGNIDTPPDDTVVWRYMNLEKLLALLGSSSLHLCRLDDLRDPWEGKWSPAALEAFCQSGRAANVAGSIIENAVKVLNMGIGKFYVSCWHESPYVSAAFWDQYQHSAGVAIRSTVGRLKKSKGLAPTFFIGRVQYLNYNDAESAKSFFGGGPLNNCFVPVFLKRKSFEHEHEVRVVVWSGTEEEKGAELNLAPTTKTFKIPIDLGELIDAIVLCPTSELWLVEPVKELLKRFGLSNAPVIRSDLYDKNLL